ncbi:MAG: glyoxalase [Myxococcaceae bacterium]|nr:glyoxalase [Myxococcaceae bacterium]
MPSNTPVRTVLGDAPITTMLPVIELSRAREFYEQKLGLTPEGMKPDGHFVYAVGGTHLALFPRPGGTRADHTAVSFEVPDIEQAVDALERNGVAFEDYDLPDLKTVHHICALGAEKAAWFKDTEGNYLCIHQTASA